MLVLLLALSTVLVGVGVRRAAVAAGSANAPALDVTTHQNATVGTLGTVDGSTFTDPRTRHEPGAEFWTPDHRAGPTSAPATAPAPTSAATPQVAATSTTAPAPATAATRTPTTAVAPAPKPVASGSWWKPAPGTTWQWQLSTPVDTSLNVQMYDIDGFDNSAAVVAAIHAKNARAVCYLSVGTAENFRSDYGSFPASVLGSSNGWPGERWIDIRQIATLTPIMTARMDLCKAKGFDAVEADNVDGYANSTGFPLTAADQIRFNTWIAGLAHARGMGVGLKNDIDQTSALLPSFDFNVNEQCNQYDECAPLEAFVAAGKAVFQVEYNMSTSQFCPADNAANFDGLSKDLNLTAVRAPCR